MGAQALCIFTSASFMATILYIFPHPDDESFGPAPAIAKQRRQGHDVHLLTLTRGEATSQRRKYGYSKREMGQQRLEEMRDVASALDLSSLTVLDFPDGELADLDPRSIESSVEDQVRATDPDVVVTYAVHGISGHPDHLVGHAVVKRVFCALRDAEDVTVQRLAFFTLPPPGDEEDRMDHLSHSAEEAIDIVVQFDDDDFSRAEAALDCYVTYQEVIEEHDPLSSVKTRGVCFETFQASWQPPLEDLTDRLDRDA